MQWTALCPQSFSERKPGESRCANGYKDYRNVRVQYRWPLGMPLVRNLGSALWEIRSALPTRIARTLFFVHQEEIVLLHGFIKKTRKTPTEDRALALQRKNAYLKSS
jgi:phage-related protein